MQLTKGIHINSHNGRKIDLEIPYNQNWSFNGRELDTDSLESVGIVSWCPYGCVNTGNLHQKNDPVNFYRIPERDKLPGEYGTYMECSECGAHKRL